MPVMRLPSATTTAATAPPSRAKATRERGNRGVATSDYRVRRRGEGRWRGVAFPWRPSGPLAREVEERQRNHGRGDLPAFALHAVLDRHPRAELLVSLVEGSETDHLLDRRPPRDRGRAADLPSFPVDRDRRTVDDRRDHHREAVFREHRLDPGPVKLQPDEAPRRTTRRALGLERSFPRELRFLPELHETPQTDLER